MDKPLKIDEVIKNIVELYTPDIFHDNKRFSALLMDFIPEKVKEKNILKIAINAGIPDKILSSYNMDNSDRNLIFSECKLILSDYYGMEKIWSDFAVNCFVYALNMGAKKPVTDSNEMLANVIMRLYNS